MARPPSCTFPGRRQCSLPTQPWQGRRHVLQPHKSSALGTWDYPAKGLLRGCWPQGTACLGFSLSA